MNNKIIFVGGVHGVGKTTLCNRIKEDLGIKNYSSSELIGRYNSLILNDNKQVDNINNNQDILLQSINKYIDKSEPIILDGHFALINKDNLIELVPIETFRGLNLLGILVIIDDPVNIVKRLEHRDNKKCDINFIAEFQNNEIEWAQSVSKDLGIDLLVVPASDRLADLYKFITSCESKKD